MFSLGGLEISLLLIIIIIVIGPKEIPNLLKHIGSFTKTIKKMSREFKSSLNEIANESDLKNVKESLTEVNEIKDNLDPTKELKEQIDSIKKTTNIFEKEIKDLNNLDNKQTK